MGWITRTLSYEACCRNLLPAVALSAIVAMTCIACDQEDENVGDFIDGSWTTGCAQNANDGKYDLINLRNGGSGVYIQEFGKYWDSLCTTDSAGYTASITATYTVGDDIADVEGAQAFDYTVTSIAFQISGGREEQAANEEARCGKTDWSTGAGVIYASDVPDKDAAGCIFSLEGVAKFDIVQKTDTQICFGLADADHDRSSADLRPVALKTGNACFSKAQ